MNRARAYIETGLRCIAALIVVMAASLAIGGFVLAVVVTFVRLSLTAVDLIAAL